MLMAHKQKLKVSEARILVYLSSIDPRLRFVKAISNRLDMDYPYCLGILGRMHAKGWLKKEEGALKHYYHVISTEAPLKKAEEMMSE